MTIWGKLAVLFPAIHVSLIVWAIYGLIRTPLVVSFAIVIAVIYLLPVLLFRLHTFFFPLRKGITDLSQPTYSPWWTGHQMQMLFMAVPALESLLHLIPGLFSLWLRMWGSKIGQRVHWTPRVEIVDRSLIEIGDNAVMGHLSILCSHLVTPIDGRASLIIQKVRIGKRAVVGGKVGLGPGSIVNDGELVRFGTTLFWKGILP